MTHTDFLPIPRYLRKNIGQTDIDINWYKRNVVDVRWTLVNVTSRSLYALITPLYCPHIAAPSQQNVLMSTSNKHLSAHLTEPVQRPVHWRVEARHVFTTRWNYTAMLTLWRAHTYTPTGGQPPSPAQPVNKRSVTGTFSQLHRVCVGEGREGTDRVVCSKQQRLKWHLSDRQSVSAVCVHALSNDIDICC